MEEAYATFVEARKRMNDMARSRGFYPIVALAPEPPTRFQSGGTSGKGGKSGRGGKKGKGKRQGQGRSQCWQVLSAPQLAGFATSAASDSFLFVGCGSRIEPWRHYVRKLD